MKKFMGIIVASAILASSALGFNITPGPQGYALTGFSSDYNSMFLVMCVDDSIMVSFKVIAPPYSITPAKKYSVQFWTDDTRRPRQDFIGMTDNMLGKLEGNVLQDQDFSNNEIYAVLPIAGLQAYQLADNSQEIMDAFVSACIPEQEKTEPDTDTDTNTETPSSGGSGGGCFIGGLF